MIKVIIYTLSGILWLTLGVLSLLNVSLPYKDIFPIAAIILTAVFINAAIVADEQRRII